MQYFNSKLLRKTFIVLFFLLFFAFTKTIFSAECNTTINLDDKSEQELKEQKDLCEKRSNELQGQIYTTSSQIEYMDTQIYLTTLQIQQTEYNIKKITEEIENLSEKIEGLNTSLNYLGTTFLKKIVEAYKRRQVNIFEIFLDSENASVLTNRLKYIKIAQDNDRRLAFQVQQTKVNFEEQKSLRDEKKKTLDDLKVTLNNQNTKLNDQKKVKQKLLEETKNDKITTDRFLQQIQKQLAAFKSFVKSSGAGSIIGANSLGGGSDGFYYSQRDERWANKTIGYSSENVLEVGCLLSSVAMTARKYGQNVTPLDLAGETDRFYGLTAYMKLPWKGVAGRSYQSIATSNIDQELNDGNYVIVGVGGCGSGGSHFVVLVKKEGDDYIMHDPIYGPDLKFHSHYSNICSAATFK